MRSLKLIRKNWPVDGTFRISRSALTTIPVIQVEITENGHVGRAECRPYARYDETQDSVSAQIEQVRDFIEDGGSIEDLQDRLKAGAARNALDCALWDLKAKMSGQPVWKLLDVPRPRPRMTAYTISLDKPEIMASAARKAKQYPVLKIKLGDKDGVAACQAILNARPDAHLIVDANEAISVDDLPRFHATLCDDRIALIEQPVHTNKTFEFNSTENPPLCADEALHTGKDLPHLKAMGYRAVNVKLDKTGGLTEALKVMKAAKANGFTIMAGCMVGSSLAMAPMTILESFADYIDLDGPLLLADDEPNGLSYEGALMHPASPQLWG